MKTKEFNKQYIAILNGIVEKAEDTIHVPISRKPNSIIERQTDPNGDDAITHYHVIEYLSNATLVLFGLETGRTHQLRVHSSWIGHPILGDSLYDKPSGIISRQALHAYKVKFIHPICKEKIIIKAEIPNDIISAIQQMR